MANGLYFFFSFSKAKQKTVKQIRSSSSITAMKEIKAHLLSSSQSFQIYFSNKLKTSSEQNWNVLFSNL